MTAKIRPRRSPVSWWAGTTWEWLLAAAPFSGGGGPGWSPDVRRILETLLPAAVVGLMMTWGTTQVLSAQMQELRDSQQELREELREMRRDLYSPAWQHQQSWPWRELQWLHEQPQEAAVPRPPNDLDTRPAAQLNWDRVMHPNLAPHEFPDGTLDHLAGRSVLVLSDLRGTVERPLYPNPLYGAHVRHRPRSPGTLDGDRHATDNGARLSDANDWFVSWTDAPAYFHAALLHPGIGGLGVYPLLSRTGTPGDYCMFHTDTRSQRVMWIGYGRTPAGRPEGYVYAHHEPARFYRMLGAILEAPA